MMDGHWLSPQPEMVEEMIASLDAAGKQDLLPLGYAFAALVFNMGFTASPASSTPSALLTPKRSNSR